jgi:hypothetical protein
MENITEQAPDAVDIVLNVDGDALVQLFYGQFGPFVALSSRRAKLDAPVRDMARLRPCYSAPASDARTHGDGGAVRPAR